MAFTLSGTTITQSGYSFDLEKGFYSEKNNKPLKINIDKKGYPKVWLYIDGKRIEVKLHRYVCFNYNGNAPKGKESVNHIDGNKMNWTPENLEWVSHKENMAHAVKMGLHKTGKHKAKGVDNNLAKLTDNIVMEIYNLKGSLSQYKIADMYNISQACVNMIITGKRWGHLILNK